MRLFSLLFFTFLFTLNPIVAQRNCATMDVLERIENEDPKVKVRMESIERHTRDYLLNKSKNRQAQIITIPVVVHVVYNAPAENISDAQIQSQIDILNDDFRRLNTDASNTPSDFVGVAADVEIEFCLATIDPNGYPTTGITRTNTSMTEFTPDDEMKFTDHGGQDAWPAYDYMNIWVCNLESTLLGYAQFPGGPLATDGVVGDYQYFGNIGTATAPFDLGRTMTHEVGHYLNLRHIWGDGNCRVDDGVSDTPVARRANYTSSPCSYPGPNSCNEGQGDLPDMFQNYMDYSDDGCMNLFTLGQKDRMRALFDPGGARESLLVSTACDPYVPPTCFDNVQNGDEEGVDCGGSSCADCPPCTNLDIEIGFDDYPSETHWIIWDSNDEIAAYGGPYIGAAAQSVINFSECLPDGCYEFEILDVFGDGICCQWGNGNYELSIDSNLIGSGGSFGDSEIVPFCVSATYIFEGPGTDWNTASNWNKNAVPPSDFTGEIIINSDCIRSGLGHFINEANITVKSGVTFTNI